MSKLPFTYHDGGRAKAGYKGTTGDCVCRSIAIVSGMPYQEVYDLLNESAQGERRGRRKKGISRARTGVYKRTIHKVMERLGFQWWPTMQIGSGCKVHLRQGELPPDKRMVVSVSRHLTAVIDGVIYDTHDPSRDGDRCVYGYWIKPAGA